MQQGLLHGLTTADAAQLALTIPDAGLASPATEVAVGSRTGSTPTLPMPGGGPAAAGLARAVLALDTFGAHTVLGEQLAEIGPARDWDDVVRPVMNALSTRWGATGRGVELEHLLSEAVATAFAQSEMTAPRPTSRGSVLLAAAPGEHHYLPLRVLAAVLRHRGVGVTVLGGDVPAAALGAAITRTGPRAVLLWAQLYPHADLDVVRRLPRTQPPAVCFVAGPAWAHRVPPPPVRWLSTLDEAADALAAAATELVLPDVDRVETPGCAQDALMTGPPLRTPDGRYLVVRGRLWRATDPRLDSDEVGVLTSELMAARRAKGVARRADDHDGVERAKARVDAAKRSLGERGPVWWDDDEPDLTRHLARTTRYATWFAEQPEGR